MSLRNLSLPHMSSTPNLEIVKATSSKIRTFLYELAEGTSNYRSLHSLTEQVEHQYHGRFLVELLQNAHDALLPPAERGGQSSRIEIALRDEGQSWALYVANDGYPFSSSNFKSLSQLGQSDKNPQESIGNKGIGFRSVLEITDSPEIYSRGCPASGRFDGYCFAFTPAVIGRLTDPVVDLFRGNDRAELPFSDLPLVNWDGQLLAKFRNSVTQAAHDEQTLPDDWLRRELTYLSPYLLPIPLEYRSGLPGVADFEQRGFVTVIRFPLRGGDAVALVQRKMEELGSRALLFLEKVSVLVIDGGDGRRELNRAEAERHGSRLRGREVTIAERSNDQAERYWSWTRRIAIANAPEPVRAALQQLPGKWPELNDAAVSLAVRVGEQPERGTLSIFLPTPIDSGCGAHVNAPFFGDMSRTLIDLGNGDEQVSSNAAVYNGFLLWAAAQLAVEAIGGELAGRQLEEARATVDLLGPWAPGQLPTARWRSLIGEAARDAGIDVANVGWFLSDRGWTTLRDTSLLHDIGDARVLTTNALRTHAVFPAYVEGLSSRHTLIENLSQAHDIGWFPSPADLADTVEFIAIEQHARSGTDWNAFWTEVESLFEGDVSALIGKRVLCCSDGELHAAGRGCTVFFNPRQGSGDDEDDVDGDNGLRDIPSALRPFIAFLAEGIQVYEERNGRLHQTRVRKLLEGGLVSRFRREDILSDVLVARTPPLPLPLSSPEAGLTRDILLWGLRLMRRFSERPRSERALRALSRLPVPCGGGWYPLGSTVFGAGWSGTYGDIVASYLTRVSTPEAAAARDRLLLPPSDERWGDDAAAYRELLQLAGAFDGVRLELVTSDSWVSQCRVTRSEFQLPARPPKVLSQANWESYRESVSHQAHPAYYSGKYVVQSFHVFPGSERYPEFDDELRLAFMDAVLASAGSWPSEWDRLQISRVEGNPDTIVLPSPLFWQLQNAAWLGLREGDELEWCRPAERWHVPALELGRGRRWQFRHLRPLPGDVANRLDTDAALAGVMQRLGMPRFDPEKRSASPRLLEALAAAVEKGDVPHWDVFLGQVRSAWKAFDPAADTPFPERLLVQRAGHQLTLERPTVASSVYLPDSTKSFLSALKLFDLPIVAIEPEDAKRLADRFVAAFADTVVRASELDPIPLVEGAPWSETAPIRLRDSARLEWVIPVVLTIAAFSGPQAQGTASKAFRRQVATFHEARLAVVGRVEIALFHGEQQVGLPVETSALWLADEHTLLLSGDTDIDTGGLSEALAQMLDRDDLEVAIRLMLSTASAHPAPEGIRRALEQLKLKDDHYRDVREQWRGDLSQVMELVVPLLDVLRPEAGIGDLVECDTEEGLVSTLDSIGAGLFRGTEIVEMARQAADTFDFGVKAVARFGAAVELSAWNVARVHRGLPPLRNEEAQGTFRNHLAMAKPLLMSLLAGIAARRPGEATFTQLREALDSLVCPEALETDFWDVSFGQAVSAFSPLLEQWAATPAEIAAVAESNTVEDLSHRLIAAGVDVDFEPIAAARDNRDRLARALMELQEAGLAWALARGSPHAADWAARSERYLASLSQDVDASGFTQLWTNDYVWTLLQRLPSDAESTPFWAEVAAAVSFADLVMRLGLTSDDLGSAAKRLDAAREEARRRSRIVTVCDKDFDASEENFTRLYSHICSADPASNVRERRSVDLAKFSELLTREPRRFQAKGSEGPKAKAASKRLSRAMENLIGLSGEIHAFRMLQERYGTSTVSAISWISGNSIFVFPDNKADDSRGCDFVMTFQGRTYHVEVKSSEGEQESFTMGSSEIRLAMELAKRSRRRREVYVVLRVANALSGAPSFELLPNPYDPRYQSQFVIEEADARVRYRLRQ